MEIEVLAVPLDDKEATAAAVADVRHRLGPIGAVVHSAGAVDTDNPAFVRKPWSGVERVVGPKVFGLDTLVECFRDEPLSLFVVYSSVAASVPSLAVGQSDYAMANAYLDTVANGSGTTVTDLLELKAVQAVYRTGSTRPVALGSVKPNIGHPLTAEGIAAFIKVVLMLHHQEQVPFRSGQEPLDHFDVAASPLYFPRASRPGPRTRVSPRSTASPTAGPTRTCCSRPRPAPRSAVQATAAGTRTEPEDRHQRHRRARGPGRRPVLGELPMSELPISGELPKSAEPRLPVVFMFSGQGSQYYGMGKELFDTDEVFRTALLRLDAVVREYLGESVVDHVFDPAKPRNHPLDDTRITHPAIVMIELALAETLRAEGIEPDYVLGSSLGEYTAAVVAGSLSG
ncbi:hypothetical protein SALBM135S_01689 [Streptomyces alboniger]